MSYNLFGLPRYPSTIFVLWTENSKHALRLAWNKISSQNFICVYKHKGGRDEFKLQYENKI